MTHDIVAKLWNLCNVLKDGGVTKMAKETGTEDQIPEGHRWADLEAKGAPDRLEFYKITFVRAEP